MTSTLVSSLLTDLVALNPYMRHLPDCTYSDSICSNPDSDFCSCGLGRTKTRVRNAFDAYTAEVTPPTVAGLRTALTQLNPYLRHDRNCIASRTSPLALDCQCRLDQVKTIARAALEAAGI